MEGGIPTASEEFFNILKELRRADPVEQLMVAGVRYINLTANFLIQHGLYYLVVAEEAETECTKRKGKTTYVDKKCVVEHIENRTGEPIEAIAGALRAFRQLVLTVVILSPNVRSLIYRSGEYILAGGMPEVRYMIGGRVVNRPTLEELAEEE